ncbi:MAG: nicotinate (nicotinamide) nucleotide adenylyltransferase, partial [Dehalococcoidales bacterium]
MKIGVLGGTFDPVHNGHIAIAEETGSALDLAEVLFIPAAQSPLKDGESVLAAKYRVEMVRLAISEHPRLSLSRIEVDRSGLSFTVDTIEELRKGLDAADELYFILGWDGLAQFPRWREPARIIEMCRLV